MKKQQVLAHLCAEMKARNLGTDLGTTEPKWTERHYTVEEVATTWGLSSDTITRIFEKEPGVFDASRNPHGRMEARKRRHRKLMIPESVVFRVYRSRLTSAA
jgi:hypothetical protein